MVTPVSVPAVGHQPVRGSILSAPAHDLDGMSSKHGILEEETCLVDTGLVGQETLMHEEHACDWAVLIDLLHHGIAAFAVTLLAHAVASGAVVLAGSPVGAIVDALARALGCGLAGSAIGVLGGGAVVCAWLQLIRVAHGFVAVVATIHNSEGLVVGVNSGWDTAIAAHVAQGVTRSHIFSRQVDVLLTLAGDANAISHCFHTSESPTRATVGLPMVLCNIATVTTMTLLNVSR